MQSHEGRTQREMGDSVPAGVKPGRDAFAYMLT
jgi:hypothetical protein